MGFDGSNFAFLIDDGVAIVEIEVADSIAGNEVRGENFAKM